VVCTADDTASGRIAVILTQRALGCDAMRRRRGKIAGGVIVGAVVLAVAMLGRRSPQPPDRPPAAANVTSTATPRAVPAPGRAKSSTTHARAAAIEPLAAGRWLVVSVHDGDTVLRLDADKRQHKVRLQGIDAAEIGQPFGTVSRDGLRALVLRKSITVHTHGQDRYGRTLGTLKIDGHDVIRQMVAEVLAGH
jgi:endonuclease YncB( thermonuclease family)